VELKQILFPVDFSECCTAAAHDVEALARGAGACLTLLYVLECPPAWYSDVEAARLSSMIDLDFVKQQRRNRLEGYLKRELDHLQPRRLVLQGEPATQIVEFATREAVSMIAMPTHGTGAFRRFLLGSCTARVLHDAPCPVWTTSHSEQVAPGRYPYRTIACALDMSSLSSDILGWASAFATQQQAQLRPFHVIELDQTSQDSAVVLARQHRRAMVCEEWERLRAHTGASGPLTIAYGELGAAVRRTTHDLEADILIIGRGKVRARFGRLRARSYAIIRESPCPVISI
jgi:nucleotide-binding universal stress UspA family protein